MPARPQARRHAWVLWGLILSSLAVAQSVFTYADSTGDLAIRARDGQGTMLDTGYKFDLKGDVRISSRSRRFTLQAANVQATIRRGAGSNSPNELQSATASGGVTVVQSAGGSSSTMSSSTATYTAQGKGALVQAKGSVRLKNLNTAKKETLIATGSSASATLNPNSKRGMDRATLNGPVSVEVVQSSAQGSRVIFTGQKLVLAGDTVTLSGNVKASGAGASRFGNLSNVDSLVVQLNEKGEMTRFTFKSGGQP